VADLGCGPGKTTFHLYQNIQPGGTVLGIDAEQRRVDYAKSKYGQQEGIDFSVGDIRRPLTEFGTFDFIWIRFVLEYFRSSSFDIVRNAKNCLRPGGILCLIDLDYNCLSHYGIPERLEKAFYGLINQLREVGDFDPYVGRKLYAYLFDLGLCDIKIHLDAHHLIYGALGDVDEFNWRKKVEVVARQSGYRFLDLYPGGFEEFLEEFNDSFADPRRFTYTPMIACWGSQP
jgi:SAM-dependent methyltransferase